MAAEARFRPRVFAQLRPFLPTDPGSADAARRACFHVEATTQQVVGVSPRDGSERRFTFEQTFDFGATGGGGGGDGDGGGVVGAAAVADASGAGGGGESGEQGALLAEEGVVAEVPARGAGAVEEGEEEEAPAGPVPATRVDVNDAVGGAALDVLFSGENVDVLVGGAAAAGKSTAVGWHAPPPQPGANGFIACGTSLRDGGVGGGAPGLAHAILASLFARVEDNYVEELTHCAELSLFLVEREAVFDLLAMPMQDDGADAEAAHARHAKKHGGKGEGGGGGGGRPKRERGTAASAAAAAAASGGGIGRGVPLSLLDHPLYGAVIEDLTCAAVRGHEEAHELIEGGLRMAALHGAFWHARAEHATVCLQLSLTQTHAPQYSGGGRAHVRRSTLRIFELPDMEAASEGPLAPVAARHDRLYGRSLRTQALDFVCECAHVLEKESKRQERLGFRQKPQHGGDAGHGHGHGHRKAPPLPIAPYGGSALSVLLRPALRCRHQLLLLVALSPCAASYGAATRALRLADRLAQLHPEALEHADPPASVPEEGAGEAEHRRLHDTRAVARRLKARLEEAEEAEELERERLHGGHHGHGHRAAIVAAKPPSPQKAAVEGGGEEEEEEEEEMSAKELRRQLELAERHLGAEQPAERDVPWEARLRRTDALRAKLHGGGHVADLAGCAAFPSSSGSVKRGGKQTGATTLAQALDRATQQGGPWLVNIDRQGALSGRLFYRLRAGGAPTHFGAGGEGAGVADVDAVIGGAEVLPLHAIVHATGGATGGGGGEEEEDDDGDGAFAAGEDARGRPLASITMEVEPGARVLLNGAEVRGAAKARGGHKLVHGDRVVMGRSCVLQVVYGPAHHAAQLALLGQPGGGAALGAAPLPQARLDLSTSLVTWQDAMAEAHAAAIVAVEEARLSALALAAAAEAAGGRAEPEPTLELVRAEQGARAAAAATTAAGGGVAPPTASQVAAAAAAATEKLWRLRASLTGARVLCIEHVLLAEELGAFAVELGRRQTFSAAFVCKNKSKAGDDEEEEGAEAGAAGGGGDEQEEAEVEEGEEDGKVWVRVTQPDPEQPAAYWSLGTARNRAALAAEMFEAFVHRCGRDLATLAEGVGGGVARTGLGALVAMEGDDDDDDGSGSDDGREHLPPLAGFGAAEDPLYEPPRAQPIGRSLVYLDALSYLLEIDEASPLVDYRGNPCGEVNINIIPYVRNRRKAPGGGAGVTWILPNQDLDRKEERLVDRTAERVHLLVRVRGARGVPQRLRNLVHASFTWYLDDAPLRTDCCAVPSVNPTFSHDCSVTEMVTEELLEYVAHEPLEVELWGSPEQPMGALPPMGRRQQVHPAPPAPEALAVNPKLLPHPPPADAGGLVGFPPLLPLGLGGGGLGDAGHGLPSAADIAALEERVEDSERELTLVHSELDARREQQERTEGEADELRERLKHVRQEDEAAFREQLRAMEEELRHAREKERQMNERIHELEDKNKSRVCAIM